MLVVHHLLSGADLGAGDVMAFEPVHRLYQSELADDALNRLPRCLHVRGSTDIAFESGILQELGSVQRAGQSGPLVVAGNGEGHIPVAGMIKTGGTVAADVAGAQRLAVLDVLLQVLHEHEGDQGIHHGNVQVLTFAGAVLFPEGGKDGVAGKQGRD